MQIKRFIQLDVDPRMDDNASPMSSYFGACWEYLLERSQFFGTNQNTSQISISNFFEKKIEFVGFYVTPSTCEELPIDVLITKVGLILTKLRWFQLFGTSQNSISKFFEKNQIFGFPCCSTCEDLSIDVSITDVGLILTKPGWFLFSG